MRAALASGVPLASEGLASFFYGPDIGSVRWLLERVDARTRSKAPSPDDDGPAAGGSVSLRSPWAGAGGRPAAGSHQLPSERQPPTPGLVHVRVVPLEFLMILKSVLLLECPTTVYPDVVDAVTSTWSTPLP